MSTVSVTKTPPPAKVQQAQPRTANGYLAQRILRDHGDDMKAGQWVTLSGYGSYYERQSLRSSLDNRVRAGMPGWALTTYIAEDSSTFCIGLMKKVKP